jgi:hypothetical protein
MNFFKLKKILKSLPLKGQRLCTIILSGTHISLMKEVGNLGG